MYFTCTEFKTLVWIAVLRPLSPSPDTTITSLDVVSRNCDLRIQKGLIVFLILRFSINNCKYTYAIIFIKCTDSFQISPASLCTWHIYTTICSLSNFPILLPSFSHTWILYMLFLCHLMFTIEFHTHNQVPSSLFPLCRLFSQLFLVFSNSIFGLIPYSRCKINAQFHRLIQIILKYKFVSNHIFVNTIFVLFHRLHQFWIFYNFFTNYGTWSFSFGYFFSCISGMLILHFTRYDFYILILILFNNNVKFTTGLLFSFFSLCLYTFWLREWLFRKPLCSII